ncbi:MAB_1171c family putative transporter [Streptomyces katsurahamanus]|uniref:DUF6545 domain-containing protein n=1 Tax=Streptomyces katsurahamanus TaxID=2577098 RepID=A0ABW9NPH1_9ACTN|nr:MAB_1171c family putative transporter [Streptomyces katsurahamanus]MQS34794.1 hypothetical protein [Streptomyces katsurahamanus]
MKDILHPLCLVIATLGFLFLLRDLRKDRRDPALVALSLVYFFSASSFALSITPVWIGVDRALGVTNIAALLAQSCVMALLVCQTSVLAHWALPPAEARRHTRNFVLAGVVVIGSLAVLFSLLTPAVQRPTGFSLYYVHDPYYKAYLTLYIGVYSLGEVYLARACWRHARQARDIWVVRGLRVITVGAVITLGYSAIRIAGVLGSVLGFSVTALEPVAWICGDIGAFLTLTGYFLPTLVLRSRALRAWAADHVVYWRLHTLWKALYRAEPSIALLRPRLPVADLIRFRSVGFHVYRRTVEIRDGMIELRPFLDPAVRVAAEARCLAAGLRDPDLAAAVTADQIRCALTRHSRRSPVGEPADYALARQPAPTAHEDMKLLLLIADFFTAPAGSRRAAEPASSGAER